MVIVKNLLCHIIFLEKNCSDPAGIADGSYTCTPDTLLDGKCTYTCRPGYDLAGSAMTHCVVAGSGVVWNVSAPACNSLYFFLIRWRSSLKTVRELSFFTRIGDHLFVGRDIIILGKLKGDLFSLGQRRQTFFSSGQRSLDQTCFLRLQHIFPRVLCETLSVPLPWYICIVVHVNYMNYVVV